jgi:hypothetical protein
LLAAVLLIAPAAYAEPILLRFQCISNTDTTNCASGETQLSVEVADSGSANGTNRVTFSFFNIGTAPSSITDVYFDDDELLSTASIINGPGVSFSAGANPPDLPAGNDIQPHFTATAGFDSNAPAQPNGVNPGESLGIIFDLLPGIAFDDVHTALLNGSLRVGLHVQGFDDDGSESFVNDPPIDPVPEPGPLALVAAGFAGIAALRARRRPAR